MRDEHKGNIVDAIARESLDFRSICRRIYRYVAIADNHDSSCTSALCKHEFLQERTCATIHQDKGVKNQRSRLGIVQLAAEFVGRKACNACADTRAGSRTESWL